MSEILQVILIVLLGGGLAFYLACIWFTRQFFAQSETQTAGYRPPISLLVPVCGVDEGARENWLSLCNQTYPEYEVLFGVVDPEDPAVPLLKELIQELTAQFPERVRLFTGLQPRGVNYKDSSLSYLLEEARYEVIVFADSDICVQSDYLATVTAPLADPEVGIVTCAYVGYRPRFLGAALASLGRCCDFIPSILIAKGLDGGMGFAIGVTMATRKTSLANFGGLHFNRIGSDYNLGKRAVAAGYRVHLSHHVLDSDTGRETLAQLAQRELRWSRTIRYNRGAQYYTMIFCHGSVYALLLAGLAMGQPWQTWELSVCAMVVGVRYLQATVAILSVGCPRLLPWLWALPLRDLLSFSVWLLGAFGQQVYWRGRHLRVQRDGLLSPWEQESIVGGQ